MGPALVTAVDAAARREVTPATSPTIEKKVETERRMKRKYFATRKTYAEKHVRRRLRLPEKLWSEEMREVVEVGDALEVLRDRGTRKRWEY